MKVLAVEDEAPIRQWIQYCISRIPGFSCITAANAKEGLLLWERESPEIVISDIEMPGMNGLEMLQQLQKRNPALYSIVLTSHEDFSYARTALKLGTAEYMLKAEMTETSLRQVLEQASLDLLEQQAKHVQVTTSRTHYLQTLILHQSEALPRETELQRQGVFLKDAPLLALACKTQNSCAAQQTLAVLPGLTAPSVCALDCGQVVLLANLASESAATPRALISACEQLVADGTAQVCGISDAAAGLTGLYTAIAQARYRVSLPFYSPQQHLFCKEAPQDIAATEEQFQIEYIRALLNQDFACAYQHLAAMFDSLTAAKPADIAAVKKLIASVTASFLHFSRDVSEDADSAVEHAKLQIANAPSLDALRTIAQNVLKPVVQLTNVSSSFTAPVRHTIAYLEQHYAEKVTLSAAAEQAAFSPEYFSRLFSKETGVNFVTYLNNLRMKHAVSLLETTDLKVYEIAEQVGFFSLSYFSTAFKKKFGQNPYEYQINYQRGKIKR